MKQELSFALSTHDGWPPVAIEGVPCTKQSEGFRVEAPPLFVKGLSVGDIIEVTFDEQRNVRTWLHRIKSGRTTVWLLRTAKGAEPEIDVTLGELASMECNVVRLPEAGAYSVDVPETCDIKKVDAHLALLDRSRVAIAFPSYRHPE
jgi:Domain of unknown function (DUF4265)